MPERSEISSGCNDCPFMHQKMRLYRELAEQQGEYARRLYEPNAGKAELKLLRAIYMATHPDATPPSDEVLLQRYQDDAEEVHERFETEKDAIVDELQDVLFACQGPLGMAAVRDGVSYSVTVCTSPTAPLEARLETARITREKD